MKLKNLLLFGLIFLFVASCGKKEEDVIKIGVVLELTGDGAELGQDAKRGIDLAIQMINDNGGINGKKLNVIYEDSQTEPKTAVAGLNKLISMGDIKIVVGALFSSSTLAMAPVAERNKIILISPGSSSPKLTNAGDYIFRIYPSDTYEGMLTANYLNRIKVNNVAILYVNNDYGVGLRDEFEKYFGGKILLSDSYAQGNRDFRQVLGKIKNSGTDWVYVPGYYNEIGYAMKQAKELNIKLRVISNIGAADNSLFTIGGDAVNGLLFTSPKLPLESDSITVSFRNNFMKNYKSEPGFPALYSFDTILLLKEVFEINYNDVEMIKKSLYGINDFKGVTGKISFDENGDVTKEFEIQIAKDGHFQKYDSVD